MGFSRQECWSRLPFPTPGDVPNPGTKPSLLCFLHWHWQTYSLQLVPPGKPPRTRAIWAVIIEKEKVACADRRDNCRTPSSVEMLFPLLLLPQAPRKSSVQPSACPRTRPAWVLRKQHHSLPATQRGHCLWGRMGTQLGMQRVEMFSHGNKFLNKIIYLHSRKMKKKILGGESSMFQELTVSLEASQTYNDL